MTNRALIIVDVQPTFTEGGALGVEGGNAVAERIADFVTENADEYGFIVTTQDWHVDPGEHFSDNPDFVDTWPPHGVAGTEEAELHEAIASLPLDDGVKKGEYAAAYSGFEGVNASGDSLEMILRNAEVTAIDVVGIAESHCVKETALDALKAGWPVRVFSDLTVPTSEELGEAARVEMDEAGVEQLDSGEAFGFYEEEEDVPIPGFDDLDDLDDFDDSDFDTANEYDVDDEYGAADFSDDEYSADDELASEDALVEDGDLYSLDDFGERSDAEVTTAGEEAKISEDLADYDLSDFDLDIDADQDAELDFSADADEADFDFSDIDYKPEF
ncbi:nicotinamidase/pyrazinamidase [Trueperella bonasi]|uniref:nicotinamidase n=1 Tax=Trueperella bonasi TaxID=312286 RepID=A0ABT9NG37_9ACTO|nr:nicotinamidase/pyrazinamidase [Trueperella bonasi]